MDNTTNAGKALFGMLAVFAELNEILLLSALKRGYRRRRLNDGRMSVIRGNLNKP
ncbi:hypothetical protein [Paenibacillus qinlingensis]|uniref:hypothetical protein n=1 Tax=Paenibacillus qinlingensis TaxID=1837343 RepID=UPI0023684901|nr:hypothetical protein [Paenibacillus qinlingensis]